MIELTTWRPALPETPYTTRTAYAPPFQKAKKRADLRALARDKRALGPAPGRVLRCVPHEVHGLLARHGVVAAVQLHAAAHENVHLAPQPHDPFRWRRGHRCVRQCRELKTAYDIV